MLHDTILTLKVEFSVYADQCFNTRVRASQTVFLLLVMQCFGIGPAFERELGKDRDFNWEGVVLHKFSQIQEPESPCIIINYP